MLRATSYLARVLLVTIFALVPCIHASAHPAAQETAQGPCRAYEKPPRPVRFFAFLHWPPIPSENALQPNIEYQVESELFVNTLGERSRWLVVDIPSDGSTNGDEQWVYAGPATEPYAWPTTWTCRENGEEDEN